jgi:hypothetical protein
MTLRAPVVIYWQTGEKLPSRYGFTVVFIIVIVEFYDGTFFN